MAKLLNAHPSNNNCINRLQNYKVRKFQDLERPSNSDSGTFKHQPCFQVAYFQRLEYSGKIQGISITFKDAWEPCVNQNTFIQRHMLQTYQTTISRFP